MIDEKRLREIDLNAPVPGDEEGRQLYYIRRLQNIIRRKSEELGRPLLSKTTTFGCQMNARDSEKLSGILRLSGFTETDSEENADFVIFNTCTVRDNADQRTFGRLGRISHIKKSRPSIKVALCGCMMQEKANVEKIRKSYPFVDLVFGTHNLYRFAEYLCEIYESDRKLYEVWSSPGSIVEDLPVERKYSYKSGVNIMFGCDNYCTYCIVPYVRGREHSREPKEILREIEGLAADGVSEVMLLGQNVNSYGTGLDEPVSFARLLDEVCKIDGIKRVRFMTPHPKDLSDDLIRVIRDNQNAARHIHLPLQSGSSRLLQKMNRHYTKEQYIALAQKIRAQIPDVAVTTDLIVGFPGETEEDVQDTLDVINQVGFDNAYTFIYSKRTGTPAAKMPDQVPSGLVHERFDRVLKAVQEQAREHARSLQGRVMEGLVEEVNSQKPGYVTARLSNNMLVHVPGEASLIGTYHPVRLKECMGFYYFGTIEDGENQDHGKRGN